MSNPRSTAASVREQKLARVIDREVAPVWHDRFARLLLRDLPTGPETFALDIHSGPGHTTAELLQRLSDNSRIVALGRDPWLMQVSKTRVRPEWKRRVYFKSGDIDDVTGMNDATYDLTVANLVLGEQVVDWEPALAELLRVTKPGGQVLATLPMSGTWREVEDLFEEMLRDEGMRREVATLQKLRRRRPKASQLVAGLRKIGLDENDYVVEHERFELLFRSGREFLFAPVIEHGPLRLWKAIIGRAEKPQALFWRFKETIDTYYAGHVLAVTVVAGLVRIRVPGGPKTQPSYAGQYWSRYPELTRLWGGPGAEQEDDDDEFDLDIDLDLDEAIDALQPPADAAAAASPDVGDGDVNLDDDDDDDDDDLDLGGDDDVDLSGLEEGPSFAQIEVSGVNELPPVDDVNLDADDDPFSGMLDELDAEAAAAAEIAAEDAKVAAKLPTPERAKTGRAPTLAAVESSPIPTSPIPTSPIPTKLPRTPSSSQVSPKPPRSESGASPIPTKLPRTPSNPQAKTARPSESGITPIPTKLPPRTKKTAPKLPPIAAKAKKKPGKLSDRLPRRTSSGVTAIPPELKGEAATPSEAPKASDSIRARLPKRDSSTKKAAAKKPTANQPTVEAPAVKTPAVKTPAAKKPATKKAAPPDIDTAPRVTMPGEADPFASMLADDEDFEEIDDLEEIEELASDSLIGASFDEEDDDLEAAFGNLRPETHSGPPPPPPPPPKKKS